MAGTLVIDTLKSSTTGPAVFQNTSGTEVGQLCRAWVNFNGTNGTIRTSFNVSSVTRSASGQYLVNMASAPAADTNYCVQTTCASGTAIGTASANGALISSSAYPNTTTQFYVFTFPNDSSATAWDANYVYAAAFR